MSHAIKLSSKSSINKSTSAYHSSPAVATFWHYLCHLSKDFVCVLCLFNYQHPLKLTLTHIGSHKQADTQTAGQTHSASQLGSPTLFFEAQLALCPLGSFLHGSTDAEMSVCVFWMFECLFSSLTVSVWISVFLPRIVSLHRRERLLFIPHWGVHNRHPHAT